MQTKKITLIILLFVSLSFFPLSNIWADDDGNNIIGVNSGIIFGREHSLWIGYPVSTWYDRQTSASIGVQYYRKIYPTVLVGPYFEYETINVADPTTHLSLPNYNGGRIGAGLNFITRIPAVLVDKLGFELGGFAGYGHAWTGLNSVSDNYGDTFKVTSVDGVDYGVIVGPVFEISPQVHLAIHFIGFQGWYFASVPDAISNNNMRLRVQLYYTL